MVLMFLFAGQEWRSRHRMGLWTWLGKVGVGCVESSSDMYTQPRVEVAESCWTAQSSARAD